VAIAAAPLAPVSTSKIATAADGSPLLQVSDSHDDVF